MTCWLWCFLDNLFPDASGALRSRLLRHTARCPRCGERAALQRQMARMLKTAAGKPLPSAKDAVLAAEVLRRARLCAAEPAAGLPENQPHVRAHPVWAVAGAAAAVLLVLVLLRPRLQAPESLAPVLASGRAVPEWILQSRRLCGLPSDGSAPAIPVGGDQTPPEEYHATGPSSAEIMAAWGPELRRRIRATGLASGSTNRVRLTWALELEHAP